MPPVNTDLTGIPPHSLNDPNLGGIARMGESEEWHAKRLFLGPMPINVAAPPTERSGTGKAKHWWLAVDARDEEDEDQIPERHAFKYFLERGGLEEEWEHHDVLRRRAKREMLRRWKHSGWDSVSNLSVQDKRRRKKWVGQTFEIGVDFFGVPMLTTEDVKLAKSLKSSDPTLSPEVSIAFSGPSLQTPREGIHASESLGEGSFAQSSASDPHYRNSRLINCSETALIPEEESQKRNTTLPFSQLLSIPSITHRAMTDGQIHRPNMFSRNGEASRTAASHPTKLPSALRPLADDVKGKSVQFLPSIPRYDEPPVPPSEVLARHSILNPDTSHGAVTTQIQRQESEEEDIRYEDVFLRDRMLVRRSRAKSGNIRPYFDAEAAKKMRDLVSYDWKEYVVIWRKGRLELYEDYSIPGKETILGHKHLAFMIPLENPYTGISLYSFTDLTFCLTCTGHHVSKEYTRKTPSFGAHVPFHRSKRTDVFVFKAKTRSRSIDWMWNIWRWLGNDIPRSLDIYCPATETRVRLQLPDLSQAGREGYKSLTRDHVVEQCRIALKHLPSWEYLIERRLRRGAHLELSWRKQAILDWVRWETDAHGIKRYWEVLYGLCLAKPHEITHLEIRIAEHRSTTVILSDGTNLREPPAVEGYLYRIKTNISQSRARIYVSTHSGCLFLIDSGRAHPPHPPIPFEDDVGTVLKDSNPSLSFQELEVKRGTRQILQADVLIDVRSIVAVRRAFQINVPLRNANTNSDETRGDQLDTGRTAEDDEDEGGDEVLSRHPDKPKLKMRRSFELLMKTGHVVRFEAYSSTVALEWIAHLTQLVEYWKHRHRVDARQEMDLIHCVTGDSPVLAQPDDGLCHERPRDHDHSCEYLPQFWNWCMLDGCLPVIKNGRLFLRRGFRGQYRLMQLVLVSGHLIQFQCKHGIAHHLRSKTTSLLEAYVCSGHFASQALPMEEYLANCDTLPRRFQDGLESDDPDSDKIFLIWYRPYAMGKSNLQREPRKDASSSDATVSSINSKRKVMVLKARSKLERNAWCMALNGEIERISRK